MATTIPQVSALSPHGNGRKTALWQVVGPSSEDMHTAGHKAMSTTKPVINGANLRWPHASVRRRPVSRRHGIATWGLAADSVRYGNRICRRADGGSSERCERHQCGLTGGSPRAARTQSCLLLGSRPARKSCSGPSQESAARSLARAAAARCVSSSSQRISARAACGPASERISWARCSSNPT